MQACSDFREAESIWSLDKSLFVHPARQDKSNDSNIQETTTKKVNSSNMHESTLLYLITLVE